MITPDHLIEKILAYNPKADVDFVRLAFEYAEAAHHDQLRASGNPYIIHPLKTAELLAEMKLPLPIIIAGLLHDVPEDTKITIEDVAKNFGSDIASMVNGITKLGKIKYRGIERYVENLRKMFVAIASDVRVILIKFADRIHNLETLSVLPSEKQQRVALESLEIYAPIANRLGMQEIRTRLEDGAFKYIMPKEYEWVAKLASQNVKVKKNYIDKVIKIVEKDLQNAHIGFVKITGRIKHLYSLYKKLIKYNRDIVQIHDLVAIRIKVNTIGECYAALGIIHQNWKPLKGRIKDYIAQPKPNGYQSLHTTVFCENGEVVEFQIRTIEMHEAAERGIAAHWQYDEDGKKINPEVRKQLQWVRDLAKEQKDLKDPETYLQSLEAMKIDIFQNRIFVFTPKGDVIDLPEGATPIDFAYHIHSDIGNQCVSARINDHIASLDSKLSSGDCCEIIIDKKRKTPNTDWLGTVKTGNARSHIKSRTKAKINKWIIDKLQTVELKIDKKK